MYSSASVEKIHSPLVGTVYESGYGFALSYVSNSMTLSMDAKRVYASYSLFLHSDGSGICTASCDTLLKDYCRMKKSDFYGGRGELTDCGLLFAQNQFKLRDGSESRNRDCTEIRFNMLPSDFVPSSEGGFVRDSVFAYPKGMWPRRICLDSSLSKKAVVAAYYICANKGTIDEYLLSGFKMRQHLHSNGRPMSKYSFDAVLKELSPYFSISKLSQEEVRGFYEKKGKSIPHQDLTTDYYRIRLIDGFGRDSEKAVTDPHSKDTNNYSGPTSDTSKKGTFENGTLENGTFENGTLENGTFENGTPKNNLFDNSVYKKNIYISTTPLNPQGMHNLPEPKDDARKERPASLNGGREECPQHIRERLGEKSALQELDCLYRLLSQMSESTYIHRCERLENIISILYEMALKGDALEEYALAVNAAYLISHRMLEIDHVSSLPNYVRTILRNAKEDSGFVKAPVREVSGYRAIVDGYRLSDDGNSQIPLYCDTESASTGEGIDDEQFRSVMMEWIRMFGFEKDGCIFIGDTPLPDEFVMDDNGRRALARGLYSFFRPHTYDALNNAYEGLEEAILSVQKAIMSLFKEKDFYLQDDSYVESRFLSKRLQSLFYIDAEGKLSLKRNIFEKAVALYLKAKSRDGILHEDKWLKTVLVNELRGYAENDTADHDFDPLNPVSVYREQFSKKDRGILNIALSEKKSARLERQVVIKEDPEGRLYETAAGNTFMFDLLQEEKMGNILTAAVRKLAL